jgi:hypothetical protein
MRLKPMHCCVSQRQRYPNSVRTCLLRTLKSVNSMAKSRDKCAAAALYSRAASFVSRMARLTPNHVRPCPAYPVALSPPRSLASAARCQAAYKAKSPYLTRRPLPMQNPIPSNLTSPSVLEPQCNPTNATARSLSSSPVPRSKLRSTSPHSCVLPNCPRVKEAQPRQQTSFQ